MNGDSVSRDAQHPDVEKRSDDPLSDSVTRHPAFGQIRAAHCQGRSFLYGSDFEHQNYIEITVARSELHRGLSDDRPFARDEIISLLVSEAQWATFVSTLNHGTGVPCTLLHVERKTIPGLTAPPSRKEQFKAELSEKLAEAEKYAKILAGLIESGGKKSEMRDAIVQLRNHLTPNVAFVARQFEEHVEKITEHAKVEIEAYLQATVSRAGLKALGGDERPIALPAESTKEKP